MQGKTAYYRLKWVRSFPDPCKREHMRQAVETKILNLNYAGKNKSSIFFTDYLNKRC
jgi:hypothetical protein